MSPPDVAALAAGVVAGDRGALARAITLVESRAAAQRPLAAELLRCIAPARRIVPRIGITGPPGAGKSTLIETFGLALVAADRRPAVLAIDPSSTVSRGSILGDKTRMERLSRAPRAFIRPSPSGATPGGVGHATREAIVVCEAAGFDPIIVETVGVGQSEVAVQQLVDCVVVLVQAGAGDELQGIKRGIIELADLVLIPRADGANLAAARHAQAEYQRALRILAGPHRQPAPVVLCSALSSDGIAAFMQALDACWHAARASGALHERRRAQAAAWFDALVDAALREQLARRHAGPRDRLRAAVADGQLDPTDAAARLLALASD
ncbi:MAG: methylmalonyl Co-A mutase-associated GTPase MeaB [Chloroflexi bacterium]|nr:methylmalonyl Co-A mutase-associated GTPase MeaB [Chloroflexota bacterium]